MTVETVRMLPSIGMKPYYRDKWRTIYFGDCQDVLPSLTDRIEMVLCDLPYGTTRCLWDTVIPFDFLWSQYSRLVRPDGVVGLFGSEPFSSQLRMSNISQFRYDWVWLKSRPNGFLNANRMPMKAHEMVSIFYAKGGRYFPQGITLKDKQNRNTGVENVYGKVKKNFIQAVTYTGYPVSVLMYDNPTRPLHPTQKSVGLCEYLIRSYTRPGETVLDNACGSGTTLLAASNAGVLSIGIDSDEKSCEIAANRCAADAIKRIREGMY